MPKQLHARPICGQCGKPVEEFTEEDGEGTLRPYVMFVARCHGAVERQKVHHADASGLNFGLAFPTATPRFAANEDGTLRLLTAWEQEHLKPGI